ncbi:MAG: hypothetical protein R3A51_03620 [Nannocystaceae bacterium]
MPGNFVGESILLATDPAGRVHLAADEFKPMGTKTGAAFVHQLDGAWKREVIAVNGGLSTPVVDLEFDQDGTVYAWIDNTPDDGFSLVTRATDGTWTPTAVESIGDNWQRFTLDANSVPVALGYTGVFGPWKLRALTGGVATFLGDTTSTSTPHLYPTTRSPVFGLDVTTPPYAVGLQDHEALAVVWPSGDAYTQVELPGTALYANLCSLPPYPDCDPGPCHETSIGVYNSEFALARTQDGALWLAAMLTHIDEVYTYAEKCYQGDCECVSKLGSDDTYGQLALFRVDPEAPTPTTVLTLTTPVIDHRAASSGSYHIGRTIDMRAHGSELAIGLRLYGPYVRLLRLDTAQL